MFLTPISSFRRIVSLTLVGVSLICFSSNFSYSGLAKEAGSGGQPARIVFDNFQPSVGPNRSTTVRATVLDPYGSAMPNVAVRWSVVEDGRHLITIDPSFGRTSNTVMIAGQESGQIKDAYVTLRANAGAVSSSLIVHYTSQSQERTQSSVFNHYAMQPASEPAEIELKDKDNNTISDIDLAVGNKQTIYARVNDRYGNHMSGVQVKWFLATPSYKKFVLLGPTTNSYTTNSIEIAWGAGEAGTVTPSKIIVIAMCGSAVAQLNVNYAGNAEPDADITFDPPEAEVQPGEQVTIKVKVVRKSDGGDITNKVKIVPELASPEAKQVINISQNKEVLTLTGLNADPTKTASLVASALIVAAGGVSRTMKVTYRRDPVVARWQVLPANIVGDNYGRTIRNDYYCIEVVIQNESGSDLALSALAFDLRGKRPRPTTSYAIVHGSLERRKLTYPRTMTLLIIGGAGTLLTGFNPFFHAVNHRATYSTFIDILSNPLEKGLTAAWQDAYPGEMARLEQDTPHDNQMIKNADYLKTRVFFPKRALFANDVPDRNDPEKVQYYLGNLLIFGYKFQRGPLRRLTP